ncbi:uncharacterized protein RJT21DRAFT_114029 [Scheffersomyces amazonensis]|uniref:uncharacterized protein n=1 Tax=Scheffersomyces amazonensis TaxID=1078765 RepID=UPI00315CAE58
MMSCDIGSSSGKDPRTTSATIPTNNPKFSVVPVSDTIIAPILPSNTAKQNSISYMQYHNAINPYDIYKYQNNTAYATTTELNHASSLTSSSSLSTYGSQIGFEQQLPLQPPQQLAQPPSPQQQQQQIQESAYQPMYPYVDSQENNYVQPYPFKDNIPFKLNIFNNQNAPIQIQHHEQLSNNFNSQNHIQHVIQKRSVISPVVVSSVGVKDNQVSTPPTSPSVYQNNSFYSQQYHQLSTHNSVPTTSSTLTYEVEDQHNHDGFFNTDIFSIGDATTAAAAAAAATVASMSGPSILPNSHIKKFANSLAHPSVIIPNTPISEGDFENSPKYITTANNDTQSSKSPTVILESQLSPYNNMRRSISSSSVIKSNVIKKESYSDPTSPMDVNKALALATKAYSRHLNNADIYDEGSEHHDHDHDEFDDDYNSRHHSLPSTYHRKSGGSNNGNDVVNNPNIKNFRNVVYQLYSERKIKEIKLIEPHLKCFKNHCNIKFNNYFDYINHCYFENNKLNFVEFRSFRCPVRECPMNLIGYEKKANLRHHVVIEHFQRGQVMTKYQNYCNELTQIIYVCGHEDCGKGFYRRDSLTRHLKLVHQNHLSLFNQKKRQMSLVQNKADHIEEEYELGITPKRRKTGT